MTHYKFALLTGLAAVIGACEAQETPMEGEPRNNEETAINDEDTPTNPDVGRGDEAAENPDQPRGAMAEADDREDATELVNEAAQTLQKMKNDPDMTALLQKSQGVFIVPDYGRGAAGVGVRGGEGVLLAHRDGSWSSPVFYDLGGISVGPQFGGEGGEIAMVLMSDRALDSFREDNTFSLNAGANLTVIDYSALGQTTTMGENVGDVVFWSDKEGAFIGATLGVTNISWDDEENPAYYNKKVTAKDVIEGKVTGPKGALEGALPGM